MHSIESINEVVRKNVSIRLSELEQGTFFSISRVNTSGDLSYSDIYFSVLEDGENFIKRVKGYRYDLKAYLAKNTKLRKIPSLRFHIDTSLDHVNKIESLLDEIHGQQRPNTK